MKLPGIQHKCPNCGHDYAAVHVVFLLTFECHDDRCISIHQNRAGAQIAGVRAIRKWFDENSGFALPLLPKLMQAEAMLDTEPLFVAYRDLGYGHSIDIDAMEIVP